MGTFRTAIEKQSWVMFKIREQGAYGLPILEDLLIGEFCLRFFSTKRTALEILHMLESTNRILRKDLKVFDLKYFDKLGNLRKEAEEKQVDLKEVDEILNEHSS